MSLALRRLGFFALRRLACLALRRLGFFALRRLSCLDGSVRVSDMETKPQYRMRIREHRTVRASELIAHPLNPRIHPDFQKEALSDILQEVGFARSLLVFETPEGKLQLIDGHLRQSLAEDQEVMVEILDVNEAEANALLLSIDPLASLALYDNPTLQALKNVVETSSDALQQLWTSLGESQEKTKAELAKTRKEIEQDIPEQFLILIECATEAEQADLLERLKKQGLNCKSLVS